MKYIQRRYELALKLLFPFLLLVVMGVHGAGTLSESKPAGAGPTELVEGQSLEHDLTAGGGEQFRISLSAGQLFHFSVEKGDLALSLALYDPEHQKLIERVSRRYERLDFAVPTVASGSYLLEVQSLESPGLPRHYILKVEPARPVTTVDRQAIRAQRLAASASVLRADWKEASLRQAIQSYDSAAGFC